MPITKESATVYVISALESKGTATRDDFDVAGIVSTFRDLIDGWDFRLLERDTFWRIASTYLRT
ncbi:hypothetical protein [Nocardia alba]|uniref:Uncharacterized protein n=1 Tax=Nocardia alba TaxID=225051 RepID=A0A4R1FP74_9NOCA|nr:hypothetical protein [Nocardia alba]TCJ96627.1 hypothetical protein DFR71_2658 [Nocardia alba]